jgi:hypothetical protein
VDPLWILATQKASYCQRKAVGAMIVPDTAQSGRSRYCSTAIPGITSAKYHSTSLVWHQWLTLDTRMTTMEEIGYHWCTQFQQIALTKDTMRVLSNDLLLTMLIRVDNSYRKFLLNTSILLATKSISPPKLMG